MNQATISIRVEPVLKQKFDMLCETFGLTTTAAFNIFMKAVVRERRIPFEIRADKPEPTGAKALAALYSIQQQSAATDGTSEMTLEEINAEIKAVRDERKRNNLRGN
ncbi:MAG: type II toxin-antitoxin system RelB/DinJ family antitoxin [Bacteroides sp.]|nr:type II toxin-antitoxin system RelB/DinJ family antitoxin [Bacteroides sp.]MBD5364946.1 type II toxin-antitoxin system RelB/DinJ family antitoxin [Bacteroides sp.]MBD5373555.1 type II toxin-antitoxin system RelB/DinJ family antitoxin [Bacteroides sp.]